MAQKNLKAFWRRLFATNVSNYSNQKKNLKAFWRRLFATNVSNYSNQMY